MSRPLLLDLFCKAGGAAMGYYRAGFDVVGVDIEPQSRYPFPFVCKDAIEAMRILLAGGGITASDGRTYTLRDFAAVHASPPCQADSVTASMPWTRGYKGEIKQLIKPTRELLIDTGLPYVIENVVGARSRLIDPIMLCGRFFGLGVFRHRLFECSVFLLQPPHLSHGTDRVGVGGICCVAGHGDCNLDRRDKLTGAVVVRQRVPKDHRSVAAWSRAMGIEWMRRDELAEAIPPAYTQFIGEQLRRAL